MDPQLTSSPEKELCPICQEHLREPVSTDWGHFFCQVCLIQQARKGTDGDILNCSVCRKPWSPSILGAGYFCEVHQKLVNWFCEEKQLFLCSQCLTSPEHRTHQDLQADAAIFHYKKQIDAEKDRLKAVLEKQQTGGQLGSSPQQWLDRLNSISEEVKGLQDKTSEAETHLNDLSTELEEASKALNITLLKNVRDLLSRTVPEKLQYLKAHSSVLKQKGEKLLQQTSSVQAPGHL